MNKTLFKLDNTVMDYAWGSTTAIAELLGLTPTGKPQAELWMGAHPKAPSKLEGPGTRLDEAIALEPRHWLGRTDHGSGLPFLLKVLAAAAPLSLQAHPSLGQAREGFERENLAGVALDAPNRNYRDANHKPELLCALTPFDALCGFRSAKEILALFSHLNTPALSEVLAPLVTEGDRGLKVAFERLMSAPKARQAQWVRDVVLACKSASEGAYSPAYAWAVRFNDQYEGDVGVLLSLWLRQVHLEPMEAIFLPAGVMHAYLDGTGIEVMANSDNVLRGGLTPKHVDVAELLSVLRFDVAPVGKVLAREVAPGVSIFETEAPDFELAIVRADAAGVELSANGAPEIYLVVEGQLRLSGDGEELTLKSGESAVVAAQRGPLRAFGPAVAYRASLPRVPA